MHTVCVLLPCCPINEPEEWREKTRLTTLGVPYRTFTGSGKTSNAPRADGGGGGSELLEFDFFSNLRRPKRHAKQVTPPTATVSHRGQTRTHDSLSVSLSLSLFLSLSLSVSPSFSLFARLPFFRRRPKYIHTSWKAAQVDRIVGVKYRRRRSSASAKRPFQVERAAVAPAIDMFAVAGLTQRNKNRCDARPESKGLNSMKTKCDAPWPMRCNLRRLGGRPSMTSAPSGPHMAAPPLEEIRPRGARNLAHSLRRPRNSDADGDRRRWTWENRKRCRLDGSPIEWSQWSYQSMRRFGSAAGERPSRRRRLRFNRSHSYESACGATGLVASSSSSVSAVAIFERHRRTVEIETRDPGGQFPAANYRRPITCQLQLAALQHRRDFD